LDRKKILEALAPCGINCERCVGFEGGEIQKASLVLKEGLEGFDKLAEKFSAFVPIFKNYKHFEEVVEFFSKADCKGCRYGTGKNSACKVMICFKEKKVEFCAECDEFPCDKTGLDGDTKKKWLNYNNRIKEIGAVEFYKESLTKSRY